MMMTTEKRTQAKGNEILMMLAENVNNLFCFICALPLLDASNAIDDDAAQDKRMAGIEKVYRMFQDSCLSFSSFKWASSCQMETKLIFLVAWRKSIVVILRLLTPRFAKKSLKTVEENRRHIRRLATCVRMRAKGCNEQASMSWQNIFSGFW